jgi:hypothetical protein
MAAMMRLNTLMRKGERRLQIRRKRRVCRFKLFSGDSKTGLAQVNMIEPVR